MGNCYRNRSLNPSASASFGRDKQYEIVGHIRAHDTDSVKSMLEEGFPIDFPMSSFNSRTPLHIAAENGAVHIAEMLLKKGAKVDPEDSGGLTPLFVAMQNCNETMLQLFSKYKANFNHRSRYNTRLNDYLTRVPQSQQRRLLNVLIRYGFNEDVRPGDEMFYEM